jgi:hypothetical protein
VSPHGGATCHVDLAKLDKGSMGKMNESMGVNRPPDHRGVLLPGCVGKSDSPVIRCDIKDVTQPITCGQMSAREWVSQAPYGDVHSTSGGHVSGGNRAMRGCCMADHGNTTHQRDSSATRSSLEFRMDTSLL